MRGKSQGSIRLSIVSKAGRVYRDDVGGAGRAATLKSSWNMSTHKSYESQGARLGRATQDAKIGSPGSLRDQQCLDFRLSSCHRAIIDWKAEEVESAGPIGFATYFFKRLK